MSDYSSELVTNNQCPSLYMSGMQYSRLFALIYLDQGFRMKYGAEYDTALAAELALVKGMGKSQKEEWLAEFFGGQPAMNAFMATIPNCNDYFEVFYSNLDCLVPGQSLQAAAEQNILWAATNSIAYNRALHRFSFGKKNDNGNLELTNNLFMPDPGSSQGCKINPVLGKILILNSMFKHVMLVDEMPSAVDGYSFAMLNDVAKNTRQAITLPSNASSC